MIGSLNCQRVVGLLDAYHHGDIEGALARLDDDIEFFANAPVDLLPHLGHHRGKAELRQMWQTVHARYSSLRYELPIILGEGDKVAANLRVYYRKRGNDRMVQFDIAAFYRLRDGKVIRIREIIDTFDLVQQIVERDIGAMLADGRPAGDNP